MPDYNTTLTGESAGTTPYVNAAPTSLTGIADLLSGPEQPMTQPLTLVVLSTGLDNFKEIRTALSADPRVQLLAGGDDAEQLYGEIVRLKPPSRSSLSARILTRESTSSRS